MAAAGTIENAGAIGMRGFSPATYFEQDLDLKQAGDDNMDWSWNTWKHSVDFTTSAPFDIIVRASNHTPAEDESEVTEYWVDARILNQTGVEWQGMRMQLGFGHGEGFTPSSSGDGLDFDAPHFDDFVDIGFTGQTETRSLGANEILLADMNLVSGNRPSLWFSIDVPNHDAMPRSVWFPDEQNVTGYEFTLRYTPMPIPEPATIGLTLGGVAALARRRRG